MQKQSERPSRQSLKIDALRARCYMAERRGREAIVNLFNEQSASFSAFYSEGKMRESLKSLEH